MAFDPSSATLIEPSKKFDPSTAKVAVDAVGLQNTNQPEDRMLKAVNASRALSGMPAVTSLDETKGEQPPELDQLQPSSWRTTMAIVKENARRYLTPLLGETDLQKSERIVHEKGAVEQAGEILPKVAANSTSATASYTGGAAQTPQFEVKGEDSPLLTGIKTAGNNIIGLIDFALSPVGLGTLELGTIAKGTGVAANAAGLGVLGAEVKFTKDLATSAVEQLQVATDPTKSANERVAAGVNATAAIIGSGMIAIHAAKGAEGAARRQEAENKMREDLKKVPIEHLEAFLQNEDFKKKWQYDPKIIEGELLERRGKQTTPEATKAAAEIEAGKVATDRSEPTRTEPADSQGEIVKDKPDQSVSSPLESPAIRNEDGTISKGKDHNEILKLQDKPTIESPTEREQNPNFGFVDSEGNFLSREEAAKRAEEHGQLTTDETPEKLHSSNLEPTDEKYQSSISKDQQAVVKGLAEDAKAKLGPGAANADEFKQLAEEQSHELASIGADKLLSGTNDKPSWKKAMLEEFPYAGEKDLNKIWRDTKDLLENFESSKKTPQARSTKFQVDVATGVRQIRASARDSISKAKAFIERLKGRQEGGEEGRKQATKELRILDKWMEAKRNELVAGLIQLAKKGDVQGKVINAILKTVVRPDIARGDFDSMARKAEQAANIIQGFADRKQRIGLQNTIQESAKSVLDSPKVSVHAKQLLREILPNLDTKAELKGLSIPELEALQSQIAWHRELGKTEWVSLRAARDGQKLQMEHDLKNDPTAKPIKEYEKIVRETPGNWQQKVADKLKNVLSYGANKWSIFEKSSLTVPRLFALFDNRQNGFLTEHVLKPLYTFSRHYQNAVNTVKANLAPVMDLHNITHEDRISAGIFSHLEQGGTEAELYRYSTDRGTLFRLLDNVKSKGLTKGQQAIYDHIRNGYDAESPRMQKFFAEHYNVELKLVDKYTARILDSRKSEAWFREREKAKGVKPETGDEITQNDAFKAFKDALSYGEKDSSNIRKGFKEERKPNAEIPLNLDIVDAYIQHMDNWHYVENFQPHFDLVRGLLDTDTFIDKYGLVGKQFVSAYVDTLSKRGQYAKAKVEKLLSAIQNRAMVGLLAFRIGQLKHLANYDLGMYEAGGVHWWGRGFAAAHTPEGKVFLKQNFPEIFNAFGGDFATRDAQNGKLSRAGFKIDTVLDYTNRASTAMGSYLRQIHDSGQDWNSWQTVGVKEDFLNNSRLAYTNAVGSPDIIDRPTIVSSKIGLGSPTYGRAVMAYQGPKLVRWGLMRDVLFQEDKLGHKATKLGILAISSLIEGAIQAGSKYAYVAAGSGLLALLGYRAVSKPKKEETLTKEYLDDVSKDFVSTFPLGSAASRVITAAQNPKAADRILRQTGIPTIDISTGIFADAATFSLSLWNKGPFAPETKRGLFDATMSASMLVPLPTSSVKQIGDDMFQAAKTKSTKTTFNPEKQPK